MNIFQTAKNRNSVWPSHTTPAYAQSILSLITEILAYPCLLLYCSPRLRWSQPRRPSTDEWIMTMCYLYTMEFYSVIKKTEIMTFSGNGLNWKLLY